MHSGGNLYRPTKTAPREPLLLSSKRIPPCSASDGELFIDPGHRACTCSSRMDCSPSGSIHGQCRRERAAETEASRLLSLRRRITPGRNRCCRRPQASGSDARRRRRRKRSSCTWTSPPSSAPDGTFSPRPCIQNPGMPRAASTTGISSARRRRSRLLRNRRLCNEAE